MARLLVVDDDDLSRSIIRDLLGGFGHQVVEAADSVEGVKCFQRFEVDIVISDLFMPQHGGWNLFGAFGPWIRIWELF